MDAPIGLAFLDYDLRCSRVNQAFASLTGRSAAEHNGQKLERLAPGLPPTLEQACRRVLASGQPAIDLEVCGILNGNEERSRNWTVSCYPVRGGTGEVAGLGLVVRDTTSRRRVDERLRFLAEAGSLIGTSLEFQATLNALVRFVVPHLADWCVVDLVENGDSIRRVAAAHADLSKENLTWAIDRPFEGDRYAPIGPCKVIQTGRPEMLPEIPDTLLQAVLGDLEYAEVLRTLGLKSYMCVPLNAHGRTIGAMTFACGQNGRRYGSVDLAIAEDLAQRAALSIENARLYQSARDNLREREELLAMVSHDLKNPLVIILMQAALVEQKAPENEAGERLRKQARSIQRAADQMSRLIRDLLDLARIEAGRLPVRRERQEAGSIIREAVQVLRPLATGKSIRLRRLRSASPVQAFCDRERILQVLSNLIGNAIKFTAESGEIQVGAETAGGEVRFSVSDSGMGMSEEELPRAFDRFWSARPGERRGTGLGLSIARGLVEAHGGRIWAESTPGKGSTFHFTLPATAPAPEVRVEASTP